jgi:hypothetical protein
MEARKMTREQWLAEKRAAVEKRRRGILALRIRAACGGLNLRERVGISHEALRLVMEMRAIAATTWPGHAVPGRLVSVNIRQPDTS